MYSLALSHGRHPNHAKVNLFKQSALPPRYAICMHWFESETGDFIPEEFSSDRGRQLSPFPQHSHQTQKRERHPTSQQIKFLSNFNVLFSSVKTVIVNSDTRIYFSEQ